MADQPEQMTSADHRGSPERSSIPGGSAIDVGWSHKSLPLQYLRGIAALSVILFHASAYLLIVKQDGRFNAVFSYEFGKFGVILFFVTSGALMALLAPRAEPSRFLLHRIVRIYPTYLLVASVYLLLAPTIGSGATFDPWAFALIPGASHVYGLGIEWTLPFEIVFYIVVSGLMMVGLAKHLHVVGAVWIGVTVIAFYAFPETQSDWQFPNLIRILITDRCTCFAAGLIVPWLVQHGLRLAPTLGTSILALVATQIFPQYDLWLYTAGCAGLVASALTPAAVRARPIPVLAKLGDWSFALYLCHVQIILTLIRHVPASWIGFPVWIMGVTTSVLIGCLVGILDVSLYAQLRRWANKTNIASRVALVGTFVFGYIVAGMVWAYR